MKKDGYEWVKTYIIIPNICRNDWAYIWFARDQMFVKAIQEEVCVLTNEKKNRNTEEIVEIPT